MVEVRPARLYDGPQLCQVCYPHYTLEEMQQALSASLTQAAAGRGLRLVAEREGQIVGCGQLSAWHRGTEITDLVVAAPFRGQGIGRTLIEALLQEARSLGLPAVEIGVEADNRRALDLYRRLGFVYRRTVRLALDGSPLTLIYLEREM
jgi:ribosomal protein S18 acetylase RimI-like enzyme